MSKVSVVIPCYNSIKFIGACIKSLRKQTFKDFDVIIVNNGSTDGSADYVRRDFPEVKLIDLPKNTGFSCAVNTGIKASDSEYVFLLNDDTACDEHAIEALVASMEKNKRAFAVQAKMLQMKHPELIDDSGDYYCALGWAFSPGRDKDESKFKKKALLTSACAGAALYRRSLFAEDKVGLFDEAHFCYLEDVDIGYRARLKGYENICEPGAIVYHEGSGSSGSRYNSFKVELTAANNLYLMYKNMPFLQILINLPLIIIGILIKHAFYTKRGLGRAHLKGLRKGVSKIFKNTEKKVSFGKKELRGCVKMQLELWINIARRFGATGA
ncbi:glycosyltransferase family 2 protein [Butyrivibrio sp. XB500-5]|uniref:glycosyltransferase family 2 protein n=1 Tax=Butyrivibrio sp. XB500-5 TaxID=2364880 RepID=UPI000EA96F30|nr:glycosyltransferase family 2 protein [Butyrivibrio sp. XB500-5]RKM59483.1 glycosyltransferase family 2 protein [Butyrivibrio sp. XB500-5]